MRVMYSYRNIKVFSLFLIWITKGLYLEISGPTMIDLKLVFNASYEEVSRSVSGRGAGGFVGALIGGILVDKFDRSLDLITALVETMAAAAVTYIPFAPDVGMLWFLCFILGACSGVANIAATRMLIILAKEQAPAMLQFLHLGYGVGALLVPLFANPFLAVLEYPSEETENSQEAFRVIKESRVHVAFIAIGLFVFLLSLLFYYFQYGYKGLKEYDTLPHSQGTSPTSFRKMINPASYANGSFWFGSLMFVLLFVYYFNLVGGEKVIAQFVRSFSVDVFKFSKTDASFLNVSFWFSITISRLLMVVVASCINIQKLFKMQILCNFLATTLFKMYAAQSSTLLCFCTLLQAFIVSPLYPSGIAYSNTLLEVKGVCLMVIVFGSGIGDMVYVWLAGYMYDSYGPKSILNAVQIAGVILFICMICFKLLERHKR